jgi:hypothetical protein
MFSFRKSTKKFKKYDAIMSDGSIVSFGDTRFEHFKDKALGLYKDLDHNDKERRKRFKQRFENKRHVKYSPSWFSDQYLW